MNGSDHSISVVIPAYNAAETLSNVLKKLLNTLQDLPVEWEILVIDDGSTDNTASLVKAFCNKKVRCLTHKRNRGYGAALRTGFLHARFPWVVTLDADGQHDPADLPKLFEVIRNNKEIALVSGMRTGFHHTPLWRYPGKWIIRHMAEFLSGTIIPDFNCGFRIYKKDIAMKYIHLCTPGYSFSTTLLLALLNRGYEVVFVPINAKPRQGTTPSNVSLKTGLATILLVLRLMTLFNPLRIFLPVSLLCILLGIVWGFPYYITGKGLSAFTLFLLLTGVIIFFMGLLADQIAELRKEKYE